MIITDLVNNYAKDIDGLTKAGSALSTAIIGWVMFWRTTSKLIPTEWENKYIRWFMRLIYFMTCILGANVPDIAKIDWKEMRIVTRSELTASKVVAAAVEPKAIVENPPPPATEVQTALDESNKKQE